jgi:protein tyrosine/serine phosphatase
MRAVARLAIVGALLIATPGCARTLYNFGTIAEGKVYRSAQPSPLFLRWLVANHGIRTLINLRGRTPGFESHFAAQRGLRLFSFDLSASRPPTEADVARFLDVATDPANQPVLVHCKNGVDRTGYMLAMYRIGEQGWTKEQALAEMRRFMQFETLNGVPATVVRDGARMLGVASVGTEPGDEAELE